MDLCNNLKKPKNYPLWDSAVKIVFLILGWIYLYYRHNYKILFSLITASIAIFVFYYFNNRSLTPLIRLQRRLNHLLKQGANYILLSGVFFLIISPFGWIYRKKGNGLLFLGKKNTNTCSYWMTRLNSKIQPDSFRKTF